MTDLERALILVPYYGAIDQQHASSVSELVKRGWLHAMVNNCALVDHSRAALAGMALRDTHDFDMVLWIDHDIVFSEGEAHAIVKTARELDAMVGAPVIIKKPRGPIMCIGLEPGKPLHFGPSAEPLECAGLPFGFTAMPMHWLRTVCESVGSSPGPGGIEVWPAFSCTRAHETGVYMSEDYSFCQRYRDLGGKCYLDTRRRVGHKGSYVYTIEDGFFELPAVDDFKVIYGDHASEVPLSAFAAEGTRTLVADAK
jgi:hypothetical protein